MLYSLTGEVVHQEPGIAVIRCGGVGYLCSVSASTQRTLPASGTVTLYTHMNVSQDAITLYGFATRSELSCFRMLTSVSGIGNKTALSALSAMTPEQLAISIAAGDHKALTCAQGIGTKQAQRIVLELKDKMAGLGAPSDVIAAGGAPAGTAAMPGSNAAEAVRALMVLGYSSGEASSLVSRLDPTLPVEKLIAQALRSADAANQ